MPDFNPVEYNNLADSLASFFFNEPIEPLTKFRRLPGAGVYALYYHGPFPAYRLLARNFRSDEFLKVPVYVGKAMPQSSKGLPARIDGALVYDRVRGHGQD